MGKRGKYLVFFLGIGLSFVHLDDCFSGQHLDEH